MTILRSTHFLHLKEKMIGTCVPIYTRSEIEESIFVGMSYQLTSLSYTCVRITFTFSLSYTKIYLASIFYIPMMHTLLCTYRRAKVDFSGLCFINDHISRFRHHHLEVGAWNIPKNQIRTIYHRPLSHSLPDTSARVCRRSTTLASTSRTSAPSWAPSSRTTRTRGGRSSMSETRSRTRQDSQKWWVAPFVITSHPHMRSRL